MRFFVPVMEHWTSSILSTGCLKGLWEFAQPVHMCFVDLEKAFDRVPMWYLQLITTACLSTAYYYDPPCITPYMIDDDVLCTCGIYCTSVRPRERDPSSVALPQGGVPSRVGGEVLSQVEEFKYLGVLFTNEGKMEREIDRRIGAASADYAVGVPDRRGEEGAESKGEALDLPVNLPPTLTYGHELWVMTERTRSQIQAAEMSFLRRVAGLSLRDRVRSFDHSARSFGVEPLLLHIERSQLRWLGHLFRMPPGRLPREVFQACPTGRRPREDPGHAGETISLSWPGNASGSPWKSWRKCLGP
ncbi:hypothetical protein L3Q82_021033 [Scortum barcoo]|uniref:Uncharacterized protein n=1 Tax=Scortum barcoo TaxID=214431 RepID=A0ACB8X4D7_9TELE|nr:hypothetical protein L3Q82_021033 [Scortum barcoo]